MIVDLDKIYNKEKELRESNLVGYFEFEELVNEVSVESDKRSPNLKKIGKCIVEVYDSEGIIPHMHVTGNGFRACVCLHTNKYFSHGEPNKYQHFANAKQREAFDEWLRQPNIKFGKGGKTNYEAAVDIWFSNGNPDYGFDMNTQPDYSIMTEEIKK